MEPAIYRSAARSSSSVSMPGPGGPQESKRRLLLVYIHGFNGSESTFQDLPVHVHGALAGLLSESHVVYTRIYPRYKSQGDFQVAVNQFSDWLLPHEADDLDVILLGHSMGGLMAADVALLQIGTKPKHRILGLVNFDTPFLGLHPHVFSFGIGSLFQKTDEISGNGLADEEQKRIFETVYSDPNFNPPDIPDIPDLNTTPQLRNDARLSERGLIKHGKHHFQKRRAEKKKREEECGGKSKISSLVAPMKFASGVNNKSELRLRYQRLQELENAAYNARRLRFVNYYTSSTGRPKTKAEKTTRRNQESVSTPRTTSFTSSNCESDRDLSESELRKFVLLPSAHWKDDKNLNWLPVTMEGMDELKAHQSMFFPKGANYDYLVGDTVALVEQWVLDDLSQRLLQDIK